jgi:nucleoside-diphosphate-sugar epimerase
MLFSGEKAKRELGFRPSISLEDGIRRSIDWYEKRGMLSHHRKGG